MEDLTTQFRNLSALPLDQKFVNLVDVLLVAYIIYRVLMLVRGTQYWRILFGVFAYLAVYFISKQIGLSTLYFILEKGTYLGPTALVILFFPELRAAIEGFMPQTTFLQRLVPSNVEERAEARTVEEIVAAVAELAGDSVGALIVVEKIALLDEYVGNGVQLQARVSAALLESIFFENNPLHDGAVIIRGDTILAAACRLPLSNSRTIDTHVHMRHRAAVGVSEVYDSLAIVVSEERGTISVASDGVLTRLSSHTELRTLLNRELRNIEEGVPAERKTHIRRRRPRVAE